MTNFFKKIIFTINNKIFNVTYKGTSYKRENILLNSKNISTGGEVFSLHRNEEKIFLKIGRGIMHVALKNNQKKFFREHKKFILFLLPRYDIKSTV